MEDIMDKLQQRAMAFKQLMNYRYDIKLGRKNKLYEFSINFEKSDFYHLIGFQKMTDLSFLKKSTGFIFSECLKGKITYSMIQRSVFFDKLGYRFDSFDKLENILDSNNLIFKCNNNLMREYSKIEADYMMKYSKNDLIFYLFTEKRRNSEFQVCKSFFENDSVDYTRGQAKLTLLYKSKVNLRNNEAEIQLNKLKS